MKLSTENIPLLIGRESSGAAYTINLANLPNLFISHSHDIQLTESFILFIKTLMENSRQACFCFSLSSRMANLALPVPANKIHTYFLHADYKEGGINTIDKFIHSVLKEMQQRKSSCQRSAVKLAALLPMVIFIDDIFEVIMSGNRKTAVYFIELLMSAATFNMFFIMGSPGIYRSLLEQIIHVNPVLKNKMKKSLQAQNISQPLGAELVMNPDGLVFYREKTEKIHKRLYPA